MMSDPDPKEFHPPEWIMTTERVAKILQKSNMKKRFPKLEIITLSELKTDLSDRQKHDEE